LGNPVDVFSRQESCFDFHGRDHDANQFFDWDVLVDQLRVRRGPKNMFVVVQVAFDLPQAKVESH